LKLRILSRYGLECVPQGFFPAFLALFSVSQLINPLTDINLPTNLREQLRYTILHNCLHPLCTGLLLCYLRSEGFQRLQPDELQLEILYLADKQLLTSEKGAVSPELKHWRTTAQGRDCLAEQGFA
jgi:hypothetical protein